MTPEGEGEDSGYWVDPNETALILTKEVVAVSKRIGGTFHSKVDRVSEGFSSISTTLDPGWIGPLLIAITNIGTERRKLKLGESFVTLILNEIEGATDLPDGNPPGRFDRLNQLEIEIGTKAVEWLNQPYTKNILALKEKISSEKVYENLGIFEEKLKKFSWNLIYFLPALILLYIALYAIQTGSGVPTISAIIAAIAVTALQAFIAVTKK